MGWLLYPVSERILVVSGLVVLVFTIACYRYWEQIGFWMLGHKCLAGLLCIIFVVFIALSSIWLADPNCLVQIFSASRGAPCWANPGTVFAVAAGLLTLLGLLATIFKIEALSAHMVNYEVLMDKLIKFVSESVEKEQKLFALFQTPMVGNVSYPSKSRELSEQLRNAVNRSLIKLICLSPVEIPTFYDSLSSTISAKQAKNIDGYSREAVEWLNSLGSGQRSKFIKYYRSSASSPTFHLIFSYQKGFLFMPFFTGRKDKKGIEMFSFEPSDPTIISSHFKKAFRYYDEKESVNAQ